MQSSWDPWGAAETSGSLQLAWSRLDDAYQAIVLSRVGVCPKKLITLFFFPDEIPNIFVCPCMGFSFNLWEGSINSILSEKEKVVRHVLYR